MKTTLKRVFAGLAAAVMVAAGAPAVFAAGATPATTTEIAVSLKTAEVTYTGTEQVPELEFKKTDNTVVTPDATKEYTVQYAKGGGTTFNDEKPKDVGDYKVKVSLTTEGKTKYTLNQEPTELTFKINKKKIDVAGKEEFKPAIVADGSDKILWKQGPPVTVRAKIKDLSEADLNKYFTFTWDVGGVRSTGQPCTFTIKDTHIGKSIRVWAVTKDTTEYTTEYIADVSTLPSVIRPIETTVEIKGPVPSQEAGKLTKGGDYEFIAVVGNETNDNRIQSNKVEWTITSNNILLSKASVTEDKETGKIRLNVAEGEKTGAKYSIVATYSANSRYFSAEREFTVVAPPAGVYVEKVTITPADAFNGQKGLGYQFYSTVKYNTFESKNPTKVEWSVVAPSGKATNSKISEGGYLTIDPNEENTVLEVVAKSVDKSLGGAQVESNRVVVNVKEATKPLPVITITSQPLNHTITPGTSTYLFVDAEADNGAKLSYEWYSVSDGTGSNPQFLDVTTQKLELPGEKFVNAGTYFYLARVVGDNVPPKYSNVVGITVSADGTNTTSGAKLSTDAPAFNTPVSVVWKNAQEPNGVKYQWFYLTPDPKDPAKNLKLNLYGTTASYTPRKDDVGRIIGVDITYTQGDTKETLIAKYGVNSNPANVQNEPGTTGNLELTPMDPKPGNTLIARLPLATNHGGGMYTFKWYKVGDANPIGNPRYITAKATDTYVSDQFVVPVEGFVGYKIKVEVTDNLQNLKGTGITNPIGGTDDDDTEKENRQEAGTVKSLKGTLYDLVIDPASAEDENRLKNAEEQLKSQNSLPILNNGQTVYRIYKDIWLRDRSTGERTLPDSVVTFEIPYSYIGSGANSYGIYNIVHVYNADNTINAYTDDKITKTGTGLKLSLDRFSPFMIMVTPKNRNGDVISLGATDTGDLDPLTGLSMAGNSFWQKVEDTIRTTPSGNRIRANAKTFDRVPVSVLTTLARYPGLTLEINWSGGESVVIPSESVVSPEANRVYYPISKLLELYGGQSAWNGTGSALLGTDDSTYPPSGLGYPTSGGYVDPNKSAYSTGGVYEVFAPDLPLLSTFVPTPSTFGLSDTIPNIRLGELNTPGAMPYILVVLSMAMITGVICGVVYYKRRNKA